MVHEWMPVPFLSAAGPSPLVRTVGAEVRLRINLRCSRASAPSRQEAQARDIDNDPRPYMEGLRQFAAKHDVPLPDASLRCGRLWRQGVLKGPADALMALFQ